MPEPLTEVPDASPDARSTIALLTREISRSLDLAGALFMHAEFRAPWTVQSRDRLEFARAVRVEASRAILFHVVLEGRYEPELSEQDKRAGKQPEVPTASGDDPLARWNLPASED